MQKGMDAEIGGIHGILQPTTEPHLDRLYRAGVPLLEIL